MQQVSKSLEIRQCIYEITVTQAIANIKFPCSFFLQWKTTNNKHSIISNNRAKAAKGIIPFNQQLNLSVLMLYNLKLQHYRKKDSIILVNLLSNSRPNDPKLVGRVEIDLASITNKNNMQELAQYPLKYCSVDGSITLKACLKSQKITNIDPNDVERSDCSQSQLFGSEFSSLREDKQSILSSNLSSASQTRQKAISKAESRVLLKALHDVKDPISRQSLGVPQMVPVRLPKKSVRIEMNSQNASNHKKSQSNGFDIEQRLQNRLKNDFSIPKLAKNTSQFDSSKVNSQKTLKNQISQKSLSKFVQSPNFSEQQPKQFSKKTIVEDKLSDNQVEAKKFYSYANSPRQKLGPAVSDNQKLRQVYQLMVNNYPQIQSQLKLKESQILELQKNLAEKDKNLQEKSCILNQKIKKIEDLQKSKIDNEQLQKTKVGYELKFIQKQNQFNKLQQRMQILLAQNEELRNFIAKQQNCMKSHNNGEQMLPSQQFIQDLNYQLETEHKNHQNTKLQLEQLRQWYSQLQQQNEQFAIEKLNLQQKLQYHQSNNNKVAQNDQFLQYKEQIMLQITEKNDQISRLTLKLAQKDKTVLQLETKINTLTQELSVLKLQFNNQQSIASSLRENLQRVNQQTEYLKTTLWQKQVETLSLNEELSLAKANTAQMSSSIQQIQRENKNSLKLKEQTAEELENRLNDLINRLKDKQASIARLQRQKQQFQSKLKQAQFGSQQYKQKLKKIEEEKLKFDEKYKLIQKQKKQLKREVEKFHLKVQNDSDSFNRTVGRLKQSLDEQIQKRKQAEKSLRQKSSKTSQLSIVRDLEEKIAEYIQRQSVLKQNLQIVEFQISKITNILIEKEQNQDYFNQNIVNLNQINAELSLRITQIQNQLNVSKQRCQALEAQVQLLNAYMPEQQDETQLFQMNKNLNDKNKQLLDIILQKNKDLNQLMKNEGQNKFNEAKTELANSRQLKEMAELQNKVNSLEQQNQKAYKQLQRLNVKYEEQLNLLQVSNQEKTKQLLSTIQYLNNHVKSLQCKDFDTYNQSKLIKEELLKVQQGLNEKQLQVDIYSNQIKELNQNIEGLQSQLNVLNIQYQNIYSQMGQKEFQLYQSNAKVKQLQQTLQKKSKNVSNANTKNDHSSEYKQKLQFYEAKMHEIERTDKQRGKQNQNLKKEIRQLKATLQQVDLQLKQKDLQAQRYKLNQKQFEEKINQIEQEQKVFTCHFKSVEEQLSTENQKLKSENQQLLKDIEAKQTLNAKLNAEITDLKQSKSTFKDESFKQMIKEIKGSQPTTPIQQFKDSPCLLATQQNEKINFKQLVEELTIVINKRKEQQEVQGVLRLVIDNNVRQEQQFQRWNRQRGAMQQKAKLASKQLQKAKSAVMKNTTRSIAQKSQITGLLKPIQGVIGQLIHLSQTLSELDVDVEQEEGQMQQIDQKSTVKV